VSRGISTFTRDITNGGSFISDEIRKRLGISFEQAEAFKCGRPEAGPPPPQLLQIVESVVDGIAGEIQRSLDFFMATSGESEIVRIFVTGGTAKLPLLAQAVERRSRVAVEVFSPLEKVMVDPSIDTNDLIALGPQLSVAMGLGMRKDREKRPS
jgi:type IV pilus assembly protein PilM